MLGYIKSGSLTSFTIGDSLFSTNLNAFDYGFIEVISGPLVPIIDSGTTARWGSNEIVPVNGSLSYDGDLGPGHGDGLSFNWSCCLLTENNSWSPDCFGSFVDQSMDNSAWVFVNTGSLQVGQTFVLRMVVAKDQRSATAEIQFNIVSEGVPLVNPR